MPNKQLKPTYPALLVLRFNATLTQNNQLRSGGLAGRYAKRAMKIKTIVYTCTILGFLFAIFGGINFGYSLKSCSFLALSGIFLGLVAAPEISPKDFKHPIVWQISFCTLGFMVVAFVLSAPPLGYLLAVLLGIIIGYLAPGWVKHINIP